MFVENIEPHIPPLHPQIPLQPDSPTIKKEHLKLPQKHNYPTEALQSTTKFILSARSCNILAVTFRVHFKNIFRIISIMFTEPHLGELYLHLWENNLEIDNSFPSDHCAYQFIVFEGV